MQPLNRSDLRPLGLRVGDLVEVRSAEEILATLGTEGRLDKIPFMPEMLQFCGKRFRVYKAAHKTCDTILRSGLRHVEGAVHLEGLRCDGSSHGECDAGCLLFWKEQWLKRVEDTSAGASPVALDRVDIPLAVLMRNTRIVPNPANPADMVYSCQATCLREFSTPLSAWNPWQYWRDWRSGNERIQDMLRALLIGIFNTLQRWRRGGQYPHLEGKCAGQTPALSLNCEAGEIVEVRTKDEIMETLNRRHRNRGLLFDREMVKYCGKPFPVLRRVRRIVDEVTGRMVEMPRDCIILDGVICKGDLDKFCPRSIYPYWREIWLRRPGEPSPPAANS